MSAPQTHSASLLQLYSGGIGVGVRVGVGVTGHHPPSGSRRHGGLWKTQGGGFTQDGVGVVDGVGVLVGVGVKVGVGVGVASVEAQLQSVSPRHF